MSAADYGAYVVEHAYADVDDLAAQARQWDVDFRQLERGPFVGELLQFGAAGVHISDARFSRALNQKGTPPEGLRTIAVPAAGITPFVWRGQQVAGDSLLVFPRGADLSSVSAADFHVYTCSIPEDLLDEACVHLGHDLNRMLGSNEAVRCPPQALASVRECLDRLRRWTLTSATDMSTEAFVARLAGELPQRLAQALAAASGTCPAATSGKRAAALTRAEAFIARHAGERVTAADISRAAGVSQRTLEYAFLERFGMSPKQYLMAYRLDAVRRQLRCAAPSSLKIADAANLWGFWHMGQFAANYRRHFGELPSETLHRAAN